MKLFSSGFNLIQPSLIQQLKKILDQYPDDGQILKVRQRLLKRFNLNSLASSPTYERLLNITIVSPAKEVELWNIWLQTSFMKWWQIDQRLWVIYCGGTVGLLWKKKCIVFSLKKKINEKRLMAGSKISSLLLCRLISLCL